MLSVKSQVLGNVMSIQLSGALDEADDLGTAIGHLKSSELHLYCKGLSRINSEGVRGWIKYFTQLTKNGVKLKFFEAPPIFVEQLNQVRNFLCGGELVSLYLPFRCISCKSELVSLIALDALEKVYKSLPMPKCPKCSGQVELDDHPGEYFAFLER
jgi:hypothetical protein